MNLLCQLSYSATIRQHQQDSNLQPGQSKCEVWPDYGTRTRVISNGVKCGGRLCWIGAFSHSATPCKQRGRIRTCGVRWDSSIEGTPTYDTHYLNSISVDFKRGNRRQPLGLALPISGVMLGSITSGVEPATRPSWGEVRLTYGTRLKINKKSLPGQQAMNPLLYQLSYRPMVKLRGPDKNRTYNRSKDHLRHPAG